MFFFKELFLSPLLMVLMVVLLGCSGSSHAPSSSVVVSCSPEHIATVEARNHVGKQATVCGKVIDYYFVQASKDKPTLLMFDQSVGRRQSGGMEKLPDVFSVVIFRKDGKNFPTHFGSFYSGKTLCTTGMIEIYDEKPVIVATTPDQIKVDC